MDMSASRAWILPTILAATVVVAAEPRSPQQYSVPSISAAITIDGQLDEPPWSTAARLELRYELRQTENGPAPVETELLLMHDEREIYLAFRAFDPDPQQIRARLNDRDRVDGDDFVGVALDTFNDARRAVEFWVNPLGVQSDLVVSENTGVEDDAWDAIWRAAGKITEQGYFVEIAIPFSSLRFHPGAEPKVWGIDAYRVYPRERSYQIGLVPRDRGLDCYLCQFDKLVGMANAHPGRNLEITPTLTGSSSQTFDPAIGQLGARESETEFGLTARWGISPNATLQATYNPDFSQVEADELLLDVNEQFALFVTEKRPFFLEGADFYETLLPALYTRTVADPEWGVKFNGKIGRSAIGLFGVRDELTNLLLPGAQRSRSITLEDQPNDTVVGRYRFDLGKNSTLGALVTSRRGGEYRNDVQGFDTHWRPTDHDTISFQWLRSSTEYPQEVLDSVISGFDQPAGRFDDSAGQLFFTHRRRSWDVRVSYRDVGGKFRGDNGFMPQVNTRRWVAGGGRTWHGTNETWYSRIHWGGDWDRTTEQDGDLIEEELETWCEFSGPRQSYAGVDLGTRKRQFAGVEYEQRFINWWAGVTPSRVVTFELEGAMGDEIDFAGRRAAKGLRFQPLIRANLGRHFNTRLSYLYRVLEVEGDWLLRANLLEARLVYQFNTRAFARAIIQRTGIDRNVEKYLFEVPVESRDLAGQLLFSYKLNPVTALYAGYSGLYQQLDQSELEPTGKTYFIKLGYAFVN